MNKIINTFEMKKKMGLREQFAHDLFKGLSSESKYIPSKYFYDKDGSKLFSKIASHQDYYLTDCELEIFKNKGKSICKYFIDSQFKLIELGAGDGRKTKMLLKNLLDMGADFTYIPVDISKDILEALVSSLEEEVPNLNVLAVVGDYLTALRWIRDNYSGKNIMMFLGSSIGNYEYADAINFLRDMWLEINDKDYLLMGMDCKKNIDIICNAYDDRDGVTKEFNLNVLKRINRELGGNFNIDMFDHCPTFNPIKGAMESYLLSKIEQNVTIEALNYTFSFDYFEPIYLECSFKYTNNICNKIAKSSGFSVVENFFDSRGYYLSSLWQVNKKHQLSINK